MGSAWAETPSPKPPRLVVVLVVDQLRQDLLTIARPWMLPARQGGFRRLAEGGVEHTRAFHDHYPLHTATGHTSLSTGALPSVHGVVGNRWLRDGVERTVDAGVDGRYPIVGGGERSKQGYAPRDVLAPSLGDVMKRASGGRSQVVSVALKDRTSVLLAGASADVAVWFDEDSGAWVTSRYYAPDGALPPFLEAWNAQNHPDRDFGRSWASELLPSPHPPAVSGASARNGVAVGYVGLGAAFPHTIDGGGAEQRGKTSFYTAWSHTPWALRANLQVALEAVDFYALGADETPDLLYLGLSSLDKVGHVYGPDSPEAWEMMLQVDRELATLLDHLDRRVGLEHCRIALTSDHGVTPLVEHLGQLRTVAGRLPLREFQQTLRARLGRTWAPEDYHLVVADPHLFVTPRPGLESQKPAMLAELSQELSQMEGVSMVLSREQLLLGQHRGTWWERQIAASVHPQRSGDLLIVTGPNAILGFTLPGGTNHGNPWTDDTHAPLLMFGWPERGVDSRRCSPRQLVSTLCLTLGLTPPAGCEVEPLPWALQSPQPSAR